jgi:hypothetical protein
MAAKSDRSAGGPVAGTGRAPGSPVNFFKNAVGSLWIVGGDVFPNFAQVGECFWMENKTAHAPPRSLLFWRSRAKAASLSIGCTRPLLTSSYRPSSRSRAWLNSARYPVRASSMSSSGAQPVVSASCRRRDSVSALRCITITASLEMLRGRVQANGQDSWAIDCSRGSPCQRVGLRTHVGLRLRRRFGSHYQ